MLHGLCIGEEAGARNLAFFRVKWLQSAIKATSSVRRLRLGSFHARMIPSMCFATSACSCVRSSRRFLNLWLQSAFEWLLHCEEKSLLDIALHPGRAQVMFLDNNIAIASHKARTHRPGWRTAHASSFVVVLGSDS